MLKRSVIVPVIVLGIAAALFFVIRSHWTSAQSDSPVQRTEDAYVQADQLPLSTRVSGRVKGVYVHDYERVHANQLLIEIDDSDYQAALKEAQSALAGAKAEYRANQTAKLAADASIATARAGVKQAEALVGVAEAAIAAAKSSSAQAEIEFNRQKALFDHKAATKEQYEQSETALKSAAAAVKGREADLARARAGIASAQAMLSAAEQQRALLDVKDAGLLAQIEARQAAVSAAQGNLEYTRIISPSDGVLGDVQTHAGQLVTPGMQLSSLVQSKIWVTANYQETQVARMQPGDPVDIRIDALSGRVFKGKVTDIAPASGSQFALFPPDNATGSFTKVVQRVPVRIAFDSDAEANLLRPGFSAEVAVHIAR